MLREGLRRLMLAAITAAVVAMPAAVATSTASANAVINWPTVRANAKGERVRTIELLLNQRGFRVPVDGVYGQDTATAVGKFQKAAKLKPNGTVGPATWRKLIITVKRGSKGNAVLAVERWLRYVYGYKSVIVDRDFGPRTQAAVKSFQSFRGLKADGIVGADTWQLLVLGR
jgi:peptidoglycan hydrolase-like protein with peptidoglycan-binding domain